MLVSMQTIPLDTRLRILARHDAGKHTRVETARLFGVSLGFVKKLLSQRESLGHVKPLHDRTGRKPTVTHAQKQAIRDIVARKPGATLWMIRERAGLSVTPQAVHVILGKMGFSLKKNASRQGAGPRRRPRRP